MIKKIASAKHGGAIAAKSWVMSANTRLSRRVKEIKYLHAALDQAISRKELCEAEIKYLKISTGVTSDQISKPINFDPICIDHDVPMRRIPPGVSKRTHKPYNAFWACPEPGCDQLID